MKLMKFCLCSVCTSSLNHGKLVSIRSHYWFPCYFRHLRMYLALGKCKNDCKILKIILAPDFCPLKPEIARFSIGFSRNYQFFGKQFFPSNLEAFLDLVSGKIEILGEIKLFLKRPMKCIMSVTLLFPNNS